MDHDIEHALRGGRRSPASWSIDEKCTAARGHADLDEAMQCPLHKRVLDRIPLLPESMLMCIADSVESMSRHVAHHYEFDAAVDAMVADAIEIPEDEKVRAVAPAWDISKTDRAGGLDDRAVARAARDRRLHAFFDSVRTSEDVDFLFLAAVMNPVAISADLATNETHANAIRALAENKSVTDDLVQSLRAHEVVGKMNSFLCWVARRPQTAESELIEFVTSGAGQVRSLALANPSFTAESYLEAYKRLNESVTSQEWDAKLSPLVQNEACPSEVLAYAAEDILSRRDEEFCNEASHLPWASKNVTAEMMDSLLTFVESDPEALKSNVVRVGLRAALSNMRAGADFLRRAASSAILDPANGSDIMGYVARNQATPQDVLNTLVERSLVGAASEDAADWGNRPFLDVLSSIIGNKSLPYETLTAIKKDKRSSKYIRSAAKRRISFIKEMQGYAASRSGDRLGGRRAEGEYFGGPSASCA